MPKAVFDSFAAEIRAKEDPGTGIYYVDSGRAVTLPNLSVMLEGLDESFVFAYKAYIYLVSRRL